MGKFMAVRKGLAGLCNLDTHYRAESYAKSVEKAVNARNGIRASIQYSSLFIQPVKRRHC